MAPLKPYQIRDRMHLGHAPIALSMQANAMSLQSRRPTSCLNLVWAQGNCVALLHNLLDSMSPATDLHNLANI